MQHDERLVYQFLGLSQPSATRVRNMQTNGQRRAHQDAAELLQITLAQLRSLGSLFDDLPFHTMPAQIDILMVAQYLGISLRALAGALAENNAQAYQGSKIAFRRWIVRHMVIEGTYRQGAPVKLNTRGVEAFEGTTIHLVDNERVIPWATWVKIWCSTNVPPDATFSLTLYQAPVPMNAPSMMAEARNLTTRAALRSDAPFTRRVFADRDLALAVSEAFGMTGDPTRSDSDREANFRRYLDMYRQYQQASEGQKRQVMQRMQQLALLIAVTANPHAEFDEIVLGAFITQQRAKEDFYGYDTTPLMNHPSAERCVAAFQAIQARPPRETVTARLQRTMQGIAGGPPPASTAVARAAARRVPTGTVPEPVPARRPGGRGEPTVAPITRPPVPPQPPGDPPTGPSQEQHVPPPAVAGVGAQVTQAREGRRTGIEATLAAISWPEGDFDYQAYLNVHRPSPINVGAPDWRTMELSDADTLGPAGQDALQYVKWCRAQDWNDQEPVISRVRLVAIQACTDLEINTNVAGEEHIIRLTLNPETLCLQLAATQLSKVQWCNLYAGGNTVMEDINTYLAGQGAEWFDWTGNGQPGGGEGAENGDAGEAEGRTPNPSGETDPVHG